MAGLVLLRSARRSLRAPTVQGNLLRRLAASLLAWQRDARQRQILRDLDDRALRDVGLSRADVEPVRHDWRSRDPRF